MGNYYCLVAGLPEIQLDDNKLSFSLKDFKEELQENLSEKDFQLIELFFRKFDNQNLLTFLKDPEAPLNDLGNLSLQDLEEIVQLIKEEDHPTDPRMPAYFKTFVTAYLEEKSLMVGQSWEDQLSTLYFIDALKTSNYYVQQWFEFNLNVTNILSALACRKYELDVRTAVVGDNEVARAVRSSNAKDFGIASIFPYLEDVLRISEESQLLERERKIDFLKWKWLEEASFFHYFSLEKVFTYLLQLEMIQRWVRLSVETGNKRFREMVETLTRSFEFPEDFKLNK